MKEILKKVAYPLMILVIAASCSSPRYASAQNDGYYDNNNGYSNNDNNNYNNNQENNNQNQDYDQNNNVMIRTISMVITTGITNMMIIPRIMMKILLM